MYISLHGAAENVKRCRDLRLYAEFRIRKHCYGQRKVLCGAKQKPQVGSSLCSGERQVQQNATDCLHAVKEHSSYPAALHARYSESSCAQPKAQPQELPACH